MGRGIAPPETFPAVHPGHDTIALKQLILDGEIKVAGLESVLLQIGTVDLLNMFEQFRICIDDTPLYREHMLNKMLERINPSPTKGGQKFAPPPTFFSITFFKVNLSKIQTLRKILYQF